MALGGAINGNLVDLLLAFALIEQLLRPSKSFFAVSIIFSAQQSNQQCVAWTN